MSTTSLPIGIWSDPTSNLDLLKTGIRTYFDNTDVAALVEWPQVFRSVQTDKYETSDFRLAAEVGAMTETGDGVPAVLETPRFGTRRDTKQKKYTNGFRITDMMKRFNQYDALPRHTRGLKKTMLEGKDLELAKVYNNASGTTYASGWDSLALASASHTCLSGDTYSNYLNADLTTAAYESAMKYFDSGIKNDQGNLLIAKARKLVVNPAFRVKAYQITKADMKPFEQSNTKYDLNTYYGFDVVPFVYHRLTASTSWFLLGDVNDEKFGPTVYTSQEPDITTEQTFDRTGDTAVYSSQMFGYNITFPYLVYVGDL